ncbi:rab-GTPase-TBC domain-containing protein [Phascolomyces articulosus]|uniref:Rab-GTPase-TBC domain-containing protein n=1 Tax=Phascolomyces articulosus TaxID=60185 RepID=A0AAD5JK76_9FUNG|nr:rab-GTPase-TBC domain-containing protein [Phascolomyces articulosus]
MLKVRSIEGGVDNSGCKRECLSETAKLEMTDTIHSRRQGWNAIFQDPNLSTESIRHRGVVGTVCQSGLRSVCWKIYTGYFPSLELSTWALIQAEHRQYYAQLKQKYIEEPAEMIKQTNSNQDLTDNNPLALNDNNPWQQYFEDSEIRKTIRQDVDRTFPDVEFFRDAEVQEKMTDILFIYCKLNADVSYRQGMHELLAPFYWVLKEESWPTEMDELDPSEPANRLIAQTLDPAYIEHDAYILFDKIMKYAKPWYEFNERISTKSQDGLRVNIPKSSTSLNPVVLSCQRIHHQYLRNADPVLYQHLERYNIEPQLYGMRWLRLLFGREFEFHELLKLWDAILAFDPSLQIAEYVCLTILLRMHDSLLASDYAQCLTLLMRAPQVKNPATLVEQAKYLQQDLSEGSGLHILQQNDLRQGKPPRHSLWDGIPRPEITENSNRIVHRRSHGANLDGIANITRGVMKSPQVRDLNRAIAGVMGTVQKNVNMFGDNVRNSLDATPPARRRLTVSSEFPSDIDRHFTGATNVRSPIARSQSSIRTTVRVPPQPQREEKQQDQDTMEKISTTNYQMADILAKSIDILETELFTGKESPDLSQQAEEKQEQNQALVINALTGIKHIRDVLSGKQSFDPAALSVVSAATTTISNNNNSTNASITNNNGSVLDDAATVGSKDDKDWEIVTDDDDKHTTTSSTSEHLETKPLPPLQQSNNDASDGQHTISRTNTAEKVSNTVKQNNVVYRIEDLISDPMLQQKGSDSTNNKFKWILQDDENELLYNSTKHPVKTASSDTPRIPALRPISKRTGLSSTDTTPMIASPSTVDPLGAEGQK